MAMGGKVTVVDAVPVETVLEAQAECSDHTLAQAALADALAGATAPRRADGDSARWRVIMEITSGRQGARAAEARIVDDEGHVIAERTVADRSSGACLPLARAVGAWAQIVLDDELSRPPPPPPPAPVTTPRMPRPEAPYPDQDRASNAETPASAELGAMLYLRNGAASTGGIAGVSVFAAFEVARSWLLRPSILAGTSTTRVADGSSRGAMLTQAGARLDLCRRVPGNYIERRGLELDACAGTDVTYIAASASEGAVETNRSAFRISVGPAIALRGELGANVGLEIRGMTGFNLARGALLADRDAPVIVASGEVGASVRFR